MSVRPFGPKDYPTLLSWLERHGVEAISKELLPKTGAVSSLGCMAFLYSTDAALGIIETLVCDPSLRGVERGRAIRECALSLIEEARKLGHRRVVCFTSIPTVSARAEAIGFQKSQKKNFVLTRSL